MHNKQCAECGVFLPENAPDNRCPKCLLALGLLTASEPSETAPTKLAATRLRTMLDAELTTMAKRRQADPPKLVQLLRGDLDWIVMKALQKDRTRRYETANALARCPALPQQRNRAGPSAQQAGGVAARSHQGRSNLLFHSV